MNRCGVCGKTHNENYLTCEKCRKKARKSQKKRTTERILNRLCITCGEPLKDETTKTCRSCLDRKSRKHLLNKLSDKDPKYEFRKFIYKGVRYPTEEEAEAARKASQSLSYQKWLNKGNNREIQKERQKISRQRKKEYIELKELSKKRRLQNDKRD